MRRPAALLLGTALALALGEGLAVPNRGATVYVDDGRRFATRRRLARADGGPHAPT